MKKYTHAWIAFKAIERLESITQNDPNCEAAESLIRWFMSHKDGVINGAWYPDSLIKDNDTGHILKLTPDLAQPGNYPALNLGMQSFRLRAKSLAWTTGYKVEPKGNLPERCEALAHSVIDNLKVQQVEARGSPVAPTGNHVAQKLFMLSHYVADAHVPLHCDSRQFSGGADVHSMMEEGWEGEVIQCIAIDTPNQRFVYGTNGYPSVPNPVVYSNSYLGPVERELSARSFSDDYGDGNSNVLEYMHAVCRYSYLLSYSFIPPKFNPTNVTRANWQALPGQTVSFGDMNTAVLADAIDSVARIWLRVWRRFADWWRKQGNATLPPGF